VKIPAPTLAPINERSTAFPAFPNRNFSQHKKTEGEEAIENDRSLPQILNLFIRGL